MQKKILAIIGLVLAIGSFKLSYAYDNGDFQFWNTEVQEKKINDKMKLALEEEFRFGDDAGDFYYQHYDIGFVYSLNSNLDLGLNYRQVYEKKNGDFKEENRPHINATLKGGLAGLELDDRSRLQYRHFDYQPDFWQYRNKLTVKFPWEFTKIKLQPYLAGEVFLSFNNKAFSRNRFYSGLAMNLTKNIKAEIYYLLQSTRNSKSSSKWTDANVLGTKIKLVF